MAGDLRKLPVIAKFLQNAGHLLFKLCLWLLLKVQSESIANFPCYIYILGGNLIISREL